MQSGSPLKPAPRRKDAAGGLKIQEAVTAVIRAAQQEPRRAPAPGAAGRPAPPQGTPAQAAGQGGAGSLRKHCWGRLNTPPANKPL